MPQLNENMEPDYERIVRRIRKLPVADDLKTEIIDGVEYCKQFSVSKTSEIRFQGVSKHTQFQKGVSIHLLDDQKEGLKGKKSTMFPACVDGIAEEGSIPNTLSSMTNDDNVIGNHCRDEFESSRRLMTDWSF
jgi:hypothetical protein